MAELMHGTESPPSEDESVAAGFPSGPSLSGLMVAYQQGELSAFEELYSHLHPPLQRYLRSMIRGSQQVEDLLQETFLQIHRSRNTYLPPRPVRPWAFGVARHVVLMDRRISKEHLKAPLEEAPIELSPPLGAADDRRLRQAVATLAPDKRKPFVLHHLFGFSFKEIGHRLGIQEGAAKVRAHRALKSLRRILGEKDA